MVIKTQSLFSGIVHHTLISTTEQKVVGNTFKHIMMSGNAEKDDFFINGSAVCKEKYDKELALSLQRERDEERALYDLQRRSRLEFFDAVQVDVVAKLLSKLIAQAELYIVQVHNPALEKFYCFTDQTIDSLDQLHQLKIFVEQIQILMKKRIESADVDGLHLLYNKLEPWPVRLEKFFQDTVCKAISHSDDTAMLKELLKLVGDTVL